MEEILKIIFGNYTLLDLFGFVWFFVIGYVFYSLNETRKRDVLGLNTPQKWSWVFWFKDNWKRYLASIIATYILFRFYIEIQGHPFTNLEALLLGLIGDGIGANAKEKIDALKADRIKIMKELNQDNIVG